MFNARASEHPVNKLFYIYTDSLKKIKHRSSLPGSAEMNQTRIHEDAGSIPGFAQWVRDLALLRAMV